jgi:hypothetical protein
VTGDSLQHGGVFFCARKAQQAQVLLGEDGTQAGRNRRVAGNLQRAAAVDGNPRRSRRNATQAGQDSMCSRICFAGAAQPGHPNTRRDSQTIRGTRWGVERIFDSNAAFDFLRADLPRAGSSASCVVQRSVHLLAHGKARPVEADPNRPRLQAEDLRNLFSGQLLHVVQHKNDA